MKNFKSKLLIALLSASVVGCAASDGFKIEKVRINDIELHVVKVSGDRIRQTCLFLDAEAENSWRHQYLMYILNDQNQAIEIAHSQNLDLESCNRYSSEVEKVLEEDSNVKVCVRDKLIPKQSSKDSSWKENADFGILGVHNVAYETLTLDSICNQKRCFGDNSAYTYTCPGFSTK